MQAAALSQISDISFVFIDLKQNYAHLDKGLQQEVDRLEKAIQRVCNSRKLPEKEIEDLFPLIFSLRVKAMRWMAEKEDGFDTVLDDVFAEIEALQANPKLRKIGINISESLACNKRLMVFLKQSDQLTNDKMRSFGELDYTSLIVSMQYMPSQVRKFLGRLTSVSLSIEFLSIATVLINEEAVKASGPKLIQLNDLMAKLSKDYQGLVRALISLGEQELLSKERDAWMTFGMRGIADAYGDDEPDYANVQLKEPNPDYIPWKRGKS